MEDIHTTAKPLKGFGGAGVLEVVKESSGGTFRVVYTVCFEDAIYVLHVIQKKAKHGIATSAWELKVVRSGLSKVQAEHESSGGSP
jgi:phage-related protein